MKADDIKKVLVVGGGTMGSQIAFDCLLAGYAVTVYDISEQVLDGIQKRFEFFAFQWPGKPPMDAASFKRALTNMTLTTDSKAAAIDADLLIEAVFEDLELKQKIFKEFEALCPPTTLLTSNTSQLLPSQIEKDILKRERFCVFHFNWPKSVVDIMRGTRTSEDMVNALKDFSRRIGYLPIITEKEIPGAIHGLLYSQWIMSALSLASGGFGSVEDIDRAWMKAEGGYFGPFASLDLVGLDTVSRLLENAAALGPGPWDDFLVFIKKLTDKGHLGVKTGKGFYTYPNPDWAKTEFLK